MIKSAETGANVLKTFDSIFNLNLFQDSFSMDISWTRYSMLQGKESKNFI